MLFKNMRFYDKQSVLNSWKSKILAKTLNLLDDAGISVRVTVLKRYIEYLLEDTHYDPYTNVFYEPIGRFKFSVDVFSTIAFEYVCEHLDEFEKVKAGMNGSM